MTASIDVYRNINVQTASPRQVILKLYALAIRSLSEAESALREGRSAKEPLQTTHQVVGGLMAALDFDAGDGELPRKLLQLYLFVLDRIHETRTHGKDTGLADARAVLTTLNEGWEGLPPADAAAAPARRSGLNLRG
jgi:flagellin-specific chaperone FliS